MLDPHFEIQGLGPVLAKLEQVKGLPRDKANRFALRKAANIIRDTAAANAQRLDDPRTPESIAENIAVRYDGGYFRETGEVKMLIGVRGGATSRQENQKNPGGDTYYWRFLELGTEKMGAQPFMRPAMDESGEAAIDEYVDQFGRALTRAIRRANRGQ